MKIVVTADGKGFLAKVKDKFIDTYAWGGTEAEAISELGKVVEALMDLRLEEIEKVRRAKKTIAEYAV